MKIDWKYIVIAILAFLLILKMQCNTGRGRTPSSHDVASIKHVWHTDTVVKTNHVPYEVIRFIDTNSAYGYAVYIDTSQVVADYYAMKYYSDTLKNDTVAKIIVNSEVYMNSLMKQTLYYSGRTTYVTTEKERFRFYVGGVFSYPVGLSPSIGGSYRRWLYTASYDVVNRQASIGTYFKLGKKW